MQQNNKGIKGGKIVGQRMVFAINGPINIFLTILFELVNVMVI
jgi:hypothetical protein